MRVYRERSGQLEGPYSVQRIEGKQAWFRDGPGVTRHFEIAQLLPEPNPRDRHLPHVHRELDHFVAPALPSSPDSFNQNKTAAIHFTECQRPAAARGRSEMCTEAKQKGLQGIYDREVFNRIHITALPTTTL